MNKMYFLLMVLGAIVFVYFAGERAGRLKCVKKQTESEMVQQSQIVKLQGDVNEETFNRGVADIRRVLREKYTITE